VQSPSKKSGVDKFNLSTMSRKSGPVKICFAFCNQRGE
jgi:hypothetical protein